MSSHCESDCIAEGIELVPSTKHKDANTKTETKTRPIIFTATSALPEPLPGFKPFRHQVGGHLMVKDDPCFMLDEDGYLLKLLEEKSLKEKIFYEKVFMTEVNNDEWFELKKYLPKYYGQVEICKAERKLCYLKMDNLIDDFENPCIMDLKIGKKTFDPYAGPDKIQRELVRYKYQAQLGFRITGFKVYRAKVGETELYDRFHCKNIKPDDIQKTFLQFFDLADYPERKQLVVEMITRLKRLLEWFNKQTRIKFFRTSLLIAYDGNVKLNRRTTNQGSTMKNPLRDLKIVSECGNIYNLESKDFLSNKFHKLGINDFISNESLKGGIDSYHNDDQMIFDNVGISMIDFAHTFIDNEGMSSSLDENYIFGLKSAISHLEQCIHL